MKRQTKTILSCLLALAMLIGMSANCFAANSFAVTEVKILDSNNGTVATYNAEQLAADPAIVVQQNAQVVRVTGTLTDTTSAAAVPYGTATYLAYLNSADVEGVLNLNNSNIQFIDQMTTAADGTVTFTYRNRSTIAPGEGAAVTAKLGGTGVAEAAGFAYTVIEDMGIFNLAGRENPPIEEGTATAVTFSISASVREMPAPLTVMLGEFNVSDAASVADGVLTIAGSKIATLPAGTYDISVAADKFVTKTLPAAVVITEPPVTELPDEVVDEIVGDIENTEVEKDAETGAVTIPVPDAASGGVVITVESANAGKVVVEGTTVSLAENVAFAKVDLDIAVTGSEKSAKKTVYMIPEGTVVSYGNIGLHTTGAGADALVYDAGADEAEQNAAFVEFVEQNSASILEDIAVALSVAMDSAKASELPHFNSALNFDDDATLSLAEYRIYRLLMNGNDPVHTFTAVNKARNK